jgi:hypothetical protein
VVAGDLAGCWAAAEQLAGRPADPLADEAAAALAAGRPAEARPAPAAQAPPGAEARA